VCPCDNVSVTFDPYTSLSVQLPQVSDMEMTLSVHTLPKSDSAHPRPVKVSVRLPRQNTTIKDLKKEIGAMLNLRPESLAIAEVNDSTIRTIHMNQDKLWEWRKCVIESDTAHAYEVEADWIDQPRYGISSFSSSSSTSMIGPAGGPSETAEPGCIFLKAVQRRKKVASTFHWNNDSSECFSTPFIVTIPATGCTYAQLRQKVVAHMRKFLKDSNTRNTKRNSSSMMLDESEAPTPSRRADADRDSYLAHNPDECSEDLLNNSFTIAWHQSRYSRVCMYLHTHH
jgi:hypothetical protein